MSNGYYGNKKKKKGWLYLGLITIASFAIYYGMNSEKFEQVTPKIIIADKITLAGWFSKKLINFTYIPIKPLIFVTEIFDSEDNILDASDISSDFIILFSVIL